jgi:CRP-like cAMP-binding protein
MRGTLAGNALFSGVAAAAIVRVWPAFRVETLAQGSLLYVAGTDAQRVFLVLGGSVAIVAEAETGCTIVALLGPGEFTGERALLQPAQRHIWTAICREETRVAFADGEAVAVALGDVPAFGINVARALHRRMRDASLAIDELVASR